MILLYITRATYCLLLNHYVNATVRRRRLHAVHLLERICISNPSVDNIFPLLYACITVVVDTIMTRHGLMYVIEQLFQNFRFFLYCTLPALVSLS